MTSRRPKILVLPGDGVGPEVTDAALQVLDAAGVDAEYVRRRIGVGLYHQAGILHEDDVFDLAVSCDAVLLGAVGDPKDAEVEQRAVKVLLDLRKTMRVYANLRPVRIYPALADRTPLRPEAVQGVDMLVVRELTGGLYFGDKGRTAESAFDTLTYTREEIERIVRRAFEFARGRRGKLTSVDKANVLETSRLWREVVNEIATGHPDVEVEHLYVDNAAMQIVVRPASFDVIVTENMFGDILSDEAAVLAGSLGMLPSASLGVTGGGLYEPVHGTAPDIAGQGKANPTGAILSAAMLVRYALADEDRASRIEAAVDSAIASGARTADLGGASSTESFTKAVISAL